MQKDFLIVVENKKFGNLKQNIMGFYGISSDDGVKLPHVEVFKAEP